MIHYKPTKKLFYGKWLYKVSYALPGASFVRHKAFDDLEEKINNIKSLSHYHKKVSDNRKELLTLTGFLKTLTSDSYDMRTETDIIDVYTNQETIFNTLVNTLSNNIRYAQKPDDPTGQALSDKKTILVKKYPQGRFKMRVYLKPHKMEDSDEKLRYLSWIKGMSGISISEAVERWFYDTKWNWDRRYVLVDDDKTLLLLRLKNSNVVGTVYNLVLQD
jgi:hypothetical protein